jgi:hypothetical protein
LVASRLLYGKAYAERKFISIYYINGILARNKLKWIEQGENPTKYFLSLGKRNYVNKTVSKLITDEGIVTSQKDI